MRRNSIRIGVFGILLAGLALLSGCLVAATSQTSHDGLFVADGTLARIEKGKTSRDWVLATIGQPSSKSTTSDGGEIWKYTYTTHTNSDTTIFLLFAGTSSDDATQTAYIEFKDAVVTNWWRG